MTSTLDDARVHPVERLWRECGLPEYFLGNGGTNTKLYALYDAIRAASARYDAECVEPEELEGVIADVSAPRAADAILKNYVVTRRTTLVSPPSEAGREMLEAFQRIQGYSDNPGLVYTICSKMIDRLSPDQGTVAVASADRCAECGHPRADHSYNGACYGLCGKFVSTISSTHHWPAGCHDPDSCARHKACMYIQCRNNGRGIAGEVEIAEAALTHPSQERA